MGASSEDLLEQAWAAFDDQEYEEAEALARRALMIDPGSVEARLAAARALINLEDHAAAIPLLREAAALEPEDAEARAVLGIALFERCEFAESLAELTIAVELEKDLPDSHYWLALAVERTGDYEAADRSFRAAAKLDPENYPLPHRISREECLRAVGRPGGGCRPSTIRSSRTSRSTSRTCRTRRSSPTTILRSIPACSDCSVGVPITERSTTTAPCVFPTRSSSSRGTSSACAPDRETLVEELYKTLYHEIGHYMGRDEDELAELGMS
jgi:tetratricopeptide (TPR) repeat protein